MADGDEFTIKGAADTQLGADRKPVQPQSDSAEESAEADESKADLEDGELPEEHAAHEELLVQYRWYKCKADAATYGPDVFYYIHFDTQESRWTEPDEPYWIFDPDTQGADSAGLQQPQATKPHGPGALEATGVDEEYKGYNPKIHGDYDPNADYAQWHNKKREEEAIAADPYRHLAQAATSSTSGYESTMALNRFTGHAQAAGLDADRHSDAAKSNRQMNAFFDVDAAANAHEGRSLKEERKSQKLSKEQVQAYNKARHEKKHKKRLQFYKS